MSRWMSVITVLLLLGLGATRVHAMHEPVENCDNYGWTAAKIVTTTSSHATTLDFVGSGGAFDPTPLLETSVKTNGRGCIIATLSAFALPRDNWILFQVLVDGQPMYGQISSDEFFTQMGFPEVAAWVQPPQQIVGDPEKNDKNLYRMVSYTFQMPVPQGTHTVTVKWAGCCTGSGPDNQNTFEVGRASLVLLYK